MRMIEETIVIDIEKLRLELLMRKSKKPTVFGRITRGVGNAIR